MSAKATCFDCVTAQKIKTTHEKAEMTYKGNRWFCSLHIEIHNKRAQAAKKAKMVLTSATR